MTMQISERDREAIARAIQRFSRTTQLVSENVVRIRISDDGRIIVYVGIQRGPRNGGGDCLEAIPVDDDWQIKHVGQWRS
jgi:hypothetical protein